MTTSALTSKLPRFMTSNVNVWTAIAVGLTTVGLYFWLRSSRGGGAGGGGNGGDARRLRRLRPPPGDSCPETEWGPLFETSLHAALMQLRDMAKPGFIFIIVEGAERDAATQRLRQWIWPDPAVRAFLQGHTATEGPAHVLPVRLMDGSDDAKLVLEVFKRRRGELPLFLFLWGKPAARLMLLRNVAGRLGGADVVRVLNDMARAQARDAEELGDDTLRELRRQQANGLLGAHSNMTASQLIQTGRFNTRDFVAETEEERETRQYGGLSAEEKAMIASAEAAAAADRAEIQATQQEEYAQAEALDRSRAEYEEAQQLEVRKQEEAAAKEQEEAEAAEIWRKFEKEDKLEKLPPEPPEGGLKIVITMPGSGRRIQRRWSADDLLQSLFDYASGSAEEGEEETFAGSFALISNFPTKRHEDGALTLGEAGLETNMVLRVSE